MKEVEFSGFKWEIKDSNEKAVGPGPNLFSNSSSSVWIDESGLHLRINKIGSKFYSAEAVLNKSLGFGEYSFIIHGDLNKLEKNAVLGAFLYENDLKEIDIEFSPIMVGKNMGQYVVQPGKNKGNVFLFKVPKLQKSLHKINWTKEKINFESFDLIKDKLIYKADYEGSDIPKNEHAKMIFNLWLYEGKKPKKEQEILITNFKFTPK